MNKITMPERNALLDQCRVALRVMSVDELRAEFQSAVEVTAHHISRLALIWAELEQRGEDMRALRSGVGVYLSAVASGRLIPEAVVRLAGNRTALRAVASLTPIQQRELLETGAVAVKRGDQGTAETVPIHRLTAADVSRAFNTIEGRVIPPGEQTSSRKRARLIVQKRVILVLTDSQHRTLLGHADRSGRSAQALILETIEELLG